MNLKYLRKASTDAIEKRIEELKYNIKENKELLGAYEEVLRERWVDTLVKDLEKVFEEKVDRLDKELLSAKEKVDRLKERV